VLVLGNAALKPNSQFGFVSAAESTVVGVEIQEHGTLSVPELLHYGQPFFPRLLENSASVMAEASTQHLKHHEICASFPTREAVEYIHPHTRRIPTKC
jgi:hypothetical protein